jgi:hypothetical protein
MITGTAMTMGMTMIIVVSIATITIMIKPTCRRLGLLPPPLAGYGIPGFSDSIARA